MHGGDRRPQASAETGTLSWRLRYGGEAPLDQSNCIYGHAVGSWEEALPMDDGTTMRLAGPVELVYAVVPIKFQGELGQHPVEGIGEARNDPERDPVVEDNASCVTTPIRYDIHTGQIIINRGRRGVPRS